MNLDGSWMHGAKWFPRPLKLKWGKKGKREEKIGYFLPILGISDRGLS